MRSCDMGCLPVRNLAGSIVSRCEIVHLLKVIGNFVCGKGVVCVDEVVVSGARTKGGLL